MKIYIGTDHRGFAQKEILKDFLSKFAEVVDVGALANNPQDDYVDFAKLVCAGVVSDSKNRGILLCGSGVGMAIAANKTPGIRAGVGHVVGEIIDARQDDDINVLALSSDYTQVDVMKDVIRAFLQTEFIPEERFTRRIAKIKEMENHA